MSWRCWRWWATVRPEIPAPTIAIFTPLYSWQRARRIKSELTRLRGKAEQQASGELVGGRRDEHVLGRGVGVAEASREGAAVLVDGGATGEPERRGRGRRSGRGGVGGGTAEGRALLDWHLAGGLGGEPRLVDRVVKEGASGVEARRCLCDFGLHGRAFSHRARAAGGLAG